MLTPLDKGQHMGLSMDEIRTQHPQFYEKFSKDHLNTRFPGGECYRDLMTRLEGVLIEIEQQTMPVLVVSHVSVLQVSDAHDTRDVAGRRPEHAYTQVLSL